MTIIEKKAQEVATGMTDRGLPNALTFNPEMISTIIGIITDVVSSFKGCKKQPTQALSAMQDPAFFERFALRRKIRNHINDGEMYGHVNSHMASTLLAMGTTLTLEDVTAMYNGH